MSLETLETKVESQDHKLDEIKGDIKRIFFIFEGDSAADDCLGLCAKVKLMWDARRTKSGLLDWSFRLIIGIILSFIAVKVGLR